VPRLVKNKDNIVTTEGISEQKISIFLWTNDWRSDNIIFILNQEWHIDIIPWLLEAFRSRYWTSPTRIFKLLGPLIGLLAFSNFWKVCFVQTWSRSFFSDHLRKKGSRSRIKGSKDLDLDHDPWSISRSLNSSDFVEIFQNLSQKSINQQFKLFP